MMNSSTGNGNSTAMTVQISTGIGGGTQRCSQRSWGDLLDTGWKDGQRIDELAGRVHGQMQMGTGGDAGQTDRADELAGRHPLAAAHRQLGLKMGVG